jgi:deoxyxylulose-5-phosphate synthase
MVNIINDNRMLISPTVEALITQYLSDWPDDPLDDELIKKIKEWQ